MLGVVQLGRTVDKAKAQLAGTIGEYNYDCPMDEALFEFLGTDGQTVLDIVKNAKNDGEIEAQLAPMVQKKNAAEIEKWNHDVVNRQPEGESHQYFLNLRNQVAPNRTDVMTWADLLDLDEKRNVPERATA
jgi:hypothetical protein